MDRKLKKKNKMGVNKEEKRNVEKQNPEEEAKEDRMEGKGLSKGIEGENNEAAERPKTQEDRRINYRSSEYIIITVELTLIVRMRS